MLTIGIDSRSMPLIIATPQPGVLDKILLYTGVEFVIFFVTTRPVNCFAL